MRRSWSTQAKDQLSEPGRAAASRLRDDHLFQININLNNITSIDLPTGDGMRTRRAADVSEVINSIISEGWDFSSPSGHPAVG